jgi:hypothetical protein
VNKTEPVRKAVVYRHDSPFQHVANVPVLATALPPIPVWLGWLIGFIPLYVLSVFFWMLVTRREEAAQAKTERGRDPEMKSDMLAVESRQREVSRQRE